MGIEINEIIGNVKILEKTDQKFYHFPVFRCECLICGRTDVMLNYNILYRRKKMHSQKGCGCLDPTKVDLTGKTYGELTVLCKKEKKDKHGNVLWHCQCSCGKMKDIPTRNLIYGSVKSCGHLRKEQVRKNLNPLTDTRIEGVAPRYFSNKKPRSDSTTGYRGVSKYLAGSKKGMRYQATLTIKGILYSKRNFLTPEDAYYNGRLQLEKEHLPQEIRDNKHVEKDIPSRSKRPVGEKALKEKNSPLEKEITTKKQSKKKIAKEKNKSAEHYIDLTGEKFGLLAPTRPLDNKLNKLTLWECRCKCGNYVTKKAYDLLREDTRGGLSCGCLKKQQEEINLREKYDEKRINGVVAPLFKGKEPRKDSSTGYRGVSKYLTRKSKEVRYRAWITVKGKRYYKSGFLTAEDAYYNGRLLLEEKHLPHKK